MRSVSVFRVYQAGKNPKSIHTITVTITPPGVLTDNAVPASILLSCLFDDNDQEPHRHSVHQGTVTWFIDGCFARL